MFQLQFPVEQIGFWSERYSYDEDAPLEANVISFMRTERYLTKPLFLKLASWKSVRIGPLCRSNSDTFVEEVTRTALTTRDERLRIEVLTLLKGVGWPVASVILHFGCEEPYPILDFRALWSLGIDPPNSYSFAFWWDYTTYARKLATDVGVDMRTLDRALWQYSKERQRTS